MATQTQKDFHRQMKELSREREEAAGSEVYSYIHDDFVDNRVKYKRRRVIGFSGVATFLVLILYFYPTISSLLHTNYSNGNTINVVNPILRTEAVSKNSPIIVFLNNEISYENQFKVISQSVSEKSNSLNMGSFDSRKQFVNLMNSNISQVQDIINGIVALQYPKSAEKYRNMVLSKYQNYLEAIHLFNLGVAKNNQKNLDKSREFFNSFNTESKQSTEELINVLKNNNIRYQLETDGTVRFWYNE